jgi:hypothetical protein
VGYILKKRYLLIQHKYAADLISKVRLTKDKKQVDAPMEANYKLKNTDGDLLDDPTMSS